MLVLLIMVDIKEVGRDGRCINRSKLKIEIWGYVLFRPIFFYVLLSCKLCSYQKSSGKHFYLDNYLKYLKTGGGRGGGGATKSMRKSVKQVESEYG